MAQLLTGLLSCKLSFEETLKTPVLTHQPLEGFVPNDGGQCAFFNLVPLDRPIALPYKTILLRGGVNSGKSTAGAAFACSRAQLDPASRGLITANSYGQLTTSTLISLAEFCRKYHVPLSPRAETVEETAKMIADRRLCKIGEASVLVLSAEAFTGKTEDSQERGRGLQIRWFWADEWAYAKGGAFNTLIGRLGRGDGELKGLGLITSSPNKNNPFNWVYDLFDNPDRDEAKRKIYVSINCPTAENKHADADYIDGLLASYTPELAEIELQGGYVKISIGKVFGYFDRSRHGLTGTDAVDFDYEAALDLQIGFDFNRNPATCLIAQRRGNDIFFIREFYLPNSDTFQLARAVCEWLREQGHRQNIYIYGDASGNSKTANSEKSNWQIVWEALKQYGFKSQCRKRYSDSNPGILDSVISVNTLLMHGRVFVLLSRCPELVKDLEQLVWKDDAIDKKTDPMRSHEGDILRYILHTLFPYKQQVAKKGRSTGTKKALPGLVV
ncbi:terminase large subunit domain-containing protein [Stenomitos frigidus]|uniref:Uncharacterized protein n=1 Tax=Stenomitos frigidus ULC18 TaxID=2107698 RepID=A0A2T1E0J2_9CYAN|nr:terminase family protein [Stenomitos frigidus]PSB26201.1 hypothetical protein C7B82_20490 [Stenomitos frigidus ULC18]